MQKRKIDWGRVWNQTVVSVLTFFSYTALHTCRQAFANAKSSMNEHWQFSKHMEGIMDAVFLFFYAVGLYISGMMGDKYNAVLVHATGLILTGIIVAIFGASIPIFGIDAKYSAYFLFLWVLNGLAQSTGWPTAVKLMGNWFGEDHAGFVFGLWSANACVGNIVGAAMVSFVLDEDWNMEWMFWLPAIFITVVGILVLLLVREKPEGLPDYTLLEKSSEPDTVASSNPDVDKSAYVNVSITDNSINMRHSHLLNGNDDSTRTALQSLLPAAAESDNTENTLHENDSTPSPSDQFPSGQKEVNSQQSKELEDANKVANAPLKSISFWDAIRIPNVIMYSICYACLKSVNYAMFFWLPYYLDNSFGANMSDDLSMMFNVGQIFGGWICGWISDPINKRSPAVFVFLVLSIVPTMMVHTRSTNKLYVGAVVTASGFLMGGPATLIPGTISADLGKHESVKDSAEALSTVAGIIDGTASFGAALMQYLVAVVSDAGWEYVFVMLALALVASTILVTPLFIREMRDLIRHGVRPGNAAASV